MKSKVSRMVVFSIMVVGSCLLLTGCVPGGSSDTGSGAVLQTMAPTALSSSRAYVGSSQCLQCHPGEYSQWQESWHKKIVQPFAVGYIGTGTITPEKYGGGKGGDGKSPVSYNDWITLAGGAGNWYTHGGRWKQRYLKKIDGLAYLDWQVAGAQYNAIEGTWGNAPAGHWDSWKRHCNWCHNSGVDLTNLYSDKVEIGVGCEACHGPGSGHVAATTNEERRLAILNPSKMSKKAQAAVCGQCHNRGKTTSTYSDGKTMDFPASYRLGDEAIPDWNIDKSGYWNSEETDFSKRVPTKHREQYPDLMYSRHFGNVSCQDCHRGHNFRIENLTDNNLCTRCHSDKSQKDKLVAHAKHVYATKNAVLQPQLLCISCHMVKTAKTAIAFDQAGHTFMKFTPRVLKTGGDATKDGDWSPSTCSQSKLGCHGWAAGPPAVDPPTEFTFEAYANPAAGTRIDRWKKRTF